MRKEALATHELARQVMRERITHGFEGFKKGDLVWLEGKNLRISYPTRKLSPKREGLFAIREVISKLSYRLTLPKSWKIHDVFHAMYLTPYRETEEYGPQTHAPPPELIGGEEEYEIEAILNHRGSRARKLRYLVSWVGYTDKEW